MINYKPKYIEKNYNVDEDSVFKKSCKILFSFIFTVIVLMCVLSLTISYGAKYFPISTGKYIGEIMFSKLFSEVPKVDTGRDFEVHQTFNELISQLPEKEYLSLKIVDDTKLKNAFAIPGGTIAITTAMLDTLKDKHAIAMILSHEIGHQINRDPLKSLSFGIVTTLFLLMTDLNNNSTDMPKLLSNVLFLNNSRGQELSADNFGLDLLMKTYSSPKGAIEAFEVLLKLEHKSKDDKVTKLNDILSTHPDTRFRLKNLKSQIEHLH